VAISLLAIALASGLAACQAIRAATTVPTTDLAALTNKTPTGTYVNDPPHTALLFSVRHFRFSQFVGRIDKVGAKLDWNLEDPAASRLDVTIPTSSIDTNSEVIDNALKAKGMFDVAAFPEAHFVSTKLTRTGPATGTILGDLTLKDETHPVKLDAVFNGGDVDGLTLAPTLGFSASGTFNRSEWRLGQWFPVIGNDVKLTIEIEFVKAP
jgi:polyisoprenoid-binding protein YceI